MKLKKPGSRLGATLKKSKVETAPMEHAEGMMPAKEEIGEVHKMAGRPKNTAVKTIDSLRELYKKKYGK